MSKKVKWGVIASGGIAKRRTIPEGVIPANNAELVAVYDSNTEVNAAMAKEYNAHEAKSIEELLNADIDVVYVASPVNRHLEHVKAAAKAKKSTFYVRNHWD